MKYEIYTLINYLKCHNIQVIWAYYEDCKVYFRIKIVTMLIWVSVLIINQSHTAITISDRRIETSFSKISYTQKFIKVKRVFIKMPTAFMHAHVWNFWSNFDGGSFSRVFIILLVCEFKNFIILVASTKYVNLVENWWCNEASHACTRKVRNLRKEQKIPNV